MTKDFSGKKGDPKQKYFHESVFHPHYDGRFTDRTLKMDERRPHLYAMIQAYLSTMADLGAETWLMHGTLMGWWWNGKILPWDSDIDVQVTVDTLSFLFNYYQLYVFHYNHPDFEEGKNYMLEINPNYINSDKWDYLNGIDARWIDMQTGIFIDITAVRVNETAKALGALDMYCKDRHKYNSSDIFPLRDSFFEDTPAKIPFEYTWVLEEEYTKESLTRTEWERHAFNETSLEWEPIKGDRYPSGKPGGPVAPSSRKKFDPTHVRDRMQRIRNGQSAVTL
ncbi:hypothetical protein MMC10_004086 [Thelotrema lepadinum]|nr:hypothetical protein [Thelotrema lepadinum]